MRTIITLALVAALTTPVLAGGHINKGMVEKRKVEKAEAAALDTAVDMSTLFTEEEIDKITNFNQLRAYLKRLAKVSEAGAKKVKRAKK